jgi:hypothetical protein
MKKDKNVERIISEEIKRLKNISEYNYYMNEADDEEFDLGDVNPEGGNPEGMNPEGGNPEGMNPELGNPEGGNPEGMNPEGGNLEGDDFQMDAEEPEDDTTEIDVTDIVQSQEEANEKTNELTMKMDNITSKLSGLFSKLGELENNASKMQDILAKVEKVSADLDMMKPPTPEETAEALAKDSYPFNVRLSKYGDEDTEETQTDLEKRKPKLSLSDLLNTFNEREVKDSFSSNNPLEREINRY